jgi:hypothetical protein
VDSLQARVESCEQSNSDLTPTEHCCRTFNWEFVERVTKYRETDGAAVFAQVHIATSSIRIHHCIMLPCALLLGFQAHQTQCRSADTVLLLL